MAGSPKEFGAKLTQALETIKANTEHSLTDIKHEIGILLGYKGSETLERWRQGKRLPKLDKLALLAKILVDPKAIDHDTILEPVGFDCWWFEEFLKYGDYPTKSRALLLDELFPFKPSGDPQPLPELSILTPETPPTVDVVGRNREFVALQIQLTAKHYTIVTGMPGIGKSSFVSAFVRRLDLPPERLFWYTLRGLDGLDSIVYRLANFLAYYGEPTFLQLLHQDRRPDSMLLDQMLLTVSGKGYLLCFDDFYRIRDAEVINQILTPLLQGAKRGDFDLLIVSREIPPGVYGVDMNSLTMEGLKEEAATQLLSTLNQSPSAEVQSLLYQLTQGNPQFLILAAEILAQQKDLGALFRRIGEETKVERFMLAEVDDHLDDQEQEVMQSLSICMEYPASYSLIEEIADRGNLRTALSNLCHRHLLLIHKDTDVTRYSQHAIIQQFYYERIPRRERLAMHARAAAYYSTEEQDVFKTALHYEKAGEYERAAEYLIGENTFLLIYQGHVSGASKILNSLTDKLSVDDGFLSGVFSALGAYYRTQGEYDAALQNFDQGLKQANSPEIEIEFLNEIVRLHRYQGVFDRALQVIEQIQAIYEQNPTLLMGPKVLNNMGWLYYRIGDIDKAEHYFTQSWGNDGLGLDVRDMANTLLCRGTVAYSRGQFEVAIDLFSQSQKLFGEIGDRIGQVHSLNNLGVIYGDQENFDQALDNLEMVLKILEDIGDVNWHIIGAYNIARIYYKQGKYSAADSYLEEDYPLAEQLQNYPLLCRYTARRAEISVHQNRLEKAKEYLETAQTWLEKIVDDEKEIGSAEQGIVYYVSGAIALVEEDYETASKAINLALPLLEKAHENEYIPLAQSVKEQALKRLST